MRVVVAVVWQGVVLLLAAMCGFVGGMVLPAVRLQRVLISTSTHLRTYDYNWIVAVVLVYVVLLLVGALRKRLRETVVSATVALVLVVAGLALFTQLGIKDVVA